MYVLMINYPQAALGGEVLVPTLEGETPLRLRPGTQPGETIRIKGKGMQRFRGYGKGDLLVRIGLSVPEKLTSQQRMLLEQLAREFGQDAQPKSRKFHF
jgi:molecular chaperone DnaJ